MAHAIQFSHETAEDAVFVCSICGALVGFNKLGVGDPQGVPFSEFVDGTWVPPVGAEDYFGDCA